jgi:two-component sensor histidine kinase
MLEKGINLIEELENVSKTHYLGREDIDVIMLDFAKRILPCLHIERMNAWLFNPEKTAIVSIGEYDLRTKEFKRNSVLEKKDFPVYFAALQDNNIIHAIDIYTHPQTSQLSESYSRPNDIFSLLDIPLRISGELIGVMCFEKTGVQKTFSRDEISFCMSLSHVLASNMESRHRRAAQEKLSKALEEKELLIKEINHRVKNNFTILMSLMRISKNRARHAETATTLEEYEQRIFSMLKIHDMLNRGKHNSAINVSEYIRELLNEFRKSYPQFDSNIISTINKSDLLFDTGKIIHLGLILSEILLDSIKHAAAQTPDYKLSLKLNEIRTGQVELRIGDNGSGFDFETESPKSTLGLPLIKDLVESMGIEASFPKPGNCLYIFTLEA